jgi:hypothetical protein
LRSSRRGRARARCHTDEDAGRPRAHARAAQRRRRVSRRDSCCARRAAGGRRQQRALALAGSGAEPSGHRADAPALGQPRACRARRHGGGLRRLSDHPRRARPRSAEPQLARQLDRALGPGLGYGNARTEARHDPGPDLRRGGCPVRRLLPRLGCPQQRLAVGGDHTHPAHPRARDDDRAAGGHRRPLPRAGGAERRALLERRLWASQHRRLAPNAHRGDRGGAGRPDQQGLGHQRHGRPLFDGCVLGRPYPHPARSSDRQRHGQHRVEDPPRPRQPIRRAGHERARRRPLDRVWRRALLHGRER